MKYFKYIVIVEYSTEVAIHRLDVSGKLDRQIKRIIDGMDINLNHEKYYIKIVEWDEELPVGDYLVGDYLQGTKK